MNVPNSLWGEAIRHATYLINRVATRSLDGKTPYEALKKRKPNLSHLKVFGCVCYAQTNKVGRKKLDDRTRVLVHLGTKPGSKAYRLVDPLSKRIVVSRNVLFDEEKEWNWRQTDETEQCDPGSFTFDLKSLSDGSDELGTPVGAYEDDGDEGLVDVDDEELTDDEEESSQPRRSSRVSTRPSYLDDYVLFSEIEGERLLLIINEEPWDFSEAKILKVWIDACKDELLSIQKNKKWDLVEVPDGVKHIGLKWVFKIKRNADGSISKYKARFIAKGYVQRHGVDFDEVFASVARVETTFDHCSSSLK